MNDHLKDLISRTASAEAYEEIRKLWQAHSIAEERRDIEGLIATLTDDSVYEIVSTQHQWIGHDGARQFYSGLLTAFPDIHFELKNIVIGPQGVFEEADVTATYRNQWLNFPEPSGQKLEFSVLILFPWDPVKRKFKGERMWYSLNDDVDFPNFEDGGSE